MAGISGLTNISQNAVGLNGSSKITPTVFTTNMSLVLGANSTASLGTTPPQAETLMTLMLVVCVQIQRLITGGVAVAGNALVFIVVIQNEILHSPGNVIAASLALADVCHGLCRLLSMFNEPIRLELPWLCYTQKIFGLLGQVGNISMILVLTVHRFIALQYPLRYNGWVTVRRVVKAMVVIWILILLFVMALVLMDMTMNIESISEPSRCLGYAYITNPVFSNIIRPLYFIGLILTGILYCKIFHIARKQAMRVNVFEMTPSGVVAVRPPIFGRAARTVSKVLLAYMLTTLPILLLDMAVPYDSDVFHSGTSLIGILRYVFSFLWFTNTVLNPTIYVLSDSVFQEKIKAALCWQC